MIIWTVYFNSSPHFSFLSWATNNGFEVPSPLSCIFPFCWIPGYYSSGPSFFLFYGDFLVQTHQMWLHKHLQGFHEHMAKGKSWQSNGKSLLGMRAHGKTGFSISRWWHKITFWWDIPEGFNFKFCWLLEICRIGINTYCRREVGL